MLVGEKYVYSGAPFEYNGGGGSDDRGWLDGYDPDTMRSTCTPPLHDADTNVVSHDPTTGAFGADVLVRLRPFGSFNAVFADGSVRSINYDIDMYVFNSLGTRNGQSVGDTTDMEGAN